MTTTLSEAESKAVLARYGVPFAPEHQVADPDGAVRAADEVGYPVAAKLCGDAFAHKTERGLVRLGLGDPAAVRRAAEELLGAATPDDGEVGVLVAPMIDGSRELIAGVSTDPQFGRTVMVGVGGVLAEAVADVAVRLVPIEASDAAEMLDDLETQALLGAFRGEPAVDRAAVAEVLLALSEAAVAEPGLVSAELNPLIISNGRPVAVDALVELADDAALATGTEVA
jgi:acetyl-CoA synthetase (ADP-forming)